MPAARADRKNDFSFRRNTLREFRLRQPDYHRSCGPVSLHQKESQEKPRHHR
jgi:hypothetical protein